MAVRMLQRRGTAAQWAAANPVLGAGELGIVMDTGIIKVGDGTTPWATLDVVYEATPAVLSVFGRTGDITANSTDLEDVTALGSSLVASVIPDDVLAILGATVLGSTLLRAAGPSAARTALEASTVGTAVFMAASAAAARTAIGITTVGAGVATAVDAASARTAIGAGTGNGNGNVTGTGVTAMRSLTQAAYDALVTKDAATLYVIVG
jgi:hypothetical protein